MSKNVEYAPQLDKLGLIGFDRWATKSNLEHAETEGLESILAQLRANGYPTTAANVERIWRATHNDSSECLRCQGSGEIPVASHDLGDGCFNDDFDTCPPCGGTGRVKS